MADLEARLIDQEQMREERDALRAQLAEVTKLAELAQADVARMRVELERQRPNRPERVAKDELQLAFEQLLADLSPAANENGAAPEAEPSAGDAGDPAPAAPPPPPRKPGRKNHGRRRLDLTTLPVERRLIEPDAVTAVGGEGWKRIGEEISDRVAFRAGGYIRLRIVRGKWVSKLATEVAPATEVAAVADNGADAAEGEVAMPSPVLVAALPESVWDRVMGDPSAVAHVAVGKYDDYSPLHRQERISDREGFHISRGTQCSWLGAGHAYLYRIVDAMFADGKAKAFCMASDATGAPVRAKGACEHWHLFVFLADLDHVIFRYSRVHTGAVMHSWLKGYRGYHLGDATGILNVVFRMEAIIEVACWAHQRRYLYKALQTDREAAMQAMSIIGKLFEVDAECRSLPLADRTVTRAARSRPLLALFDAWVARYEGKADPRGPLERAITYYKNQREALHRFLEDGRLRLDNNLSEQQLRAVVQGRHNWGFFANETGLQWYTTYRSLIASCALHQLNPERYLEQVLRLAPHWPTTRMIELAPKYWLATLAKLDARHRAIVTRPWEEVPATGGADTASQDDADLAAAA